MMVILLGVLLFGLLILVHEAGHFLTAKLFHIKIHAFSVGMGPAIFKKQHGEVLYSLRCLPIGGYVMLEGEDEASADPRAFNNQPPLKRIAVLCAGGFMNILAGFLLFTILFAMVPQITVPTVDDVIAGSPAAENGIIAGDKIIRMNGRAVHIQNDVTLSLLESGGNPIRVTIDRMGEKHECVVTPQKNENGYILGYYPKTEKMSLGLNLKMAFYNTFFVVRLVGFSLREMITGNVRLSDMAGPVGIVNEMNTAAKSSMPFENIINLMGLIAVNLGVMNLLPVPALDGGRIFFILVELVRRKQIKPEHEGLVHAIGFAILLGFMLLITFSDISKLF